MSTSYETAIFCRSILNTLDRLLECLNGLNEEQLNWRPPASNTNSLYILVAHTLGNTEENLLYTLLGQVGSRNREQEFLAQGSSGDELVTYWRALREHLQTVLLNLTSADLAREYAHPRRGIVIGFDILLIVARHTAEHLGQAELTRDLMLVATMQ